MPAALRNRAAQVNGPTIRHARKKPLSVGNHTQSCVICKNPRRARCSILRPNRTSEHYSSRVPDHGFIRLASCNCNHVVILPNSEGWRWRSRTPVYVLMFARAFGHRAAAHLRCSARTRSRHCRAARIHGRDWDYSLPGSADSDMLRWATVSNRGYTKAMPMAPLSTNMSTIPRGIGSTAYHFGHRSFRCTVLERGALAFYG